ncbi:MAG: hypothetical protein K0R34_2811 [Herbinix sp.]|nr:hypothetical protein [Herbinix sp.]
MYNKNKGLKTDYQIIIENKIVISFNTDRKRENLMKLLNNTRKITCLSNISYP